MEIWKDIPGYEGIYQASNFGNVKSLNYLRSKKERILKPSNNGYLFVNLCNKGKKITHTIHSIIAMTFDGHIPNGMNAVIDHIDNDPLNNHSDNLRITTNRENTSKDRKGGTSKYVGVSWNKVKNKWVANIELNSKTIYLGSFTNEIEASQAYQTKLKQIQLS